MTELVDLLEQVRTHYLSMFEQQLSQLRRKGRNLFVEFPPQADGGLVRNGIFVGTRCDVLVAEGQSAKPAFFQMDRKLSYPPLEFVAGETSIIIAPFHWCGVDVTINGDADKITGALVAWFEEAFVPSADNWSETLKNAAHDISNLRIERGQVACTIDLGSAPVEAVIGLIVALVQAGASAVKFDDPADAKR